MIFIFHIEFLYFTRLPNMFVYLCTNGWNSLMILFQSFLKWIVLLNMTNIIAIIPNCLPLLSSWKRRKVVYPRTPSPNEHNQCLWYTSLHQLHTRFPGNTRLYFYRLWQAPGHTSCPHAKPWWRHPKHCPA